MAGATERGDRPVRLSVTIPSLTGADVTQQRESFGAVAGASKHATLALPSHPGPGLTQRASDPLGYGLASIY